MPHLSHKKGPVGDPLPIVTQQVLCQQSDVMTSGKFDEKLPVLFIADVTI